MRVLIVEDEPSMGALLEQLVRHLWPNATVCVETNAPSAIAQWDSAGADLALLDLELPGISGLEVLKHIKKASSRTLCVMVSGHADRESILAAGAQHVDAFIVKPFEIDEVKNRLSQLMAASRPEDDTEARVETFGSLDAFIAFHLAQGTLGLPIDPAFVTALKGIRQLDLDEMRRLLERGHRDPALVLRVLGLANSHGYLRGTDPLETFETALRRIGLNGLINLAVEMSLLPGSVLTADLLRAKALVFERDCQALADIVTRLRAQVEFDLEVARTACRLYRVGELSLLQLMQAWIDRGHAIDEPLCAAVLKRHGARASDQIISQWHLPNTIRARIEAAHFLPPGAVRKEQVLMRIAGLRHAGDPEQELPRLLARLGLQPSALEPRPDAADPGDPDPGAKTDQGVSSRSSTP